MKKGVIKNNKITLEGLILFLGIVLIASLVLAAHVILTSTGGTSYSINEDVNFSFNISVNNTNLGQPSNITSVNITLPAGFTFATGTNGTNSTHNTTFVSDGSVLSWTNGTAGYVVNGSERMVFWFNASASKPGNYNITVNTTNHINGSFVTNISVEVNDTTNPTAAFGVNPINASYSSSSTVVFDIRGYDAYSVSGIKLWGNWSGAWAVNYSNNSIANNTFMNISLSLSDGSYLWGIYVNDTANNTDWTDTNRTFVVDTTNPAMNYSTGTEVNDYNASRAWVYINVSATETNEANITFRLYYTNGTSVNSTTYTTSIRTINWTSLSEGIYSYNITVIDYAGNSNITSARNITVDTTSPTPSVSCTATTIRAGDSISCSCSGTDATSGINSSATTPDSSPDTTSLSGTQTYTCSVTDYSGNSASMSTTYTVTSGGGSSGGGGSSSPFFWTKGTHTVTDDQFVESFTKELSIKQRFKVKVDSLDHYVGVIGLTSTTAIINVTSEPQQATLTVGDERMFEVSGDEYYDVLVKLNSIENNVANITIKSIHELVTEEAIMGEEIKEEKATEETTATEEIEEESLNDLIWLWILIVVFIVLILIVGGYKKLNNSSPSSTRNIRKHSSH